jgi:hypothetical protein
MIINHKINLVDEKIEEIKENQIKSIIRNIKKKFWKNMNQ